MKVLIIDILENKYIYENESCNTITEVIYICNQQKYIPATYIETFDETQVKSFLNTNHILRITNYEN